MVSDLYTPSFYVSATRRSVLQSRNVKCLDDHRNGGVKLRARSA